MESVQVEIFGQMYSIKGAADAPYIRSIAAMVDAKMREVQATTGTLDPHRVAILAALTIADELQRLKDEHESLKRSADAGLRRLLELTKQDSGG